MPAYLAPISLRLTSLRTWRDFQRLLATSSDPATSWRGHLRVLESVLGPQPPREGIALGVTQYEEAPNDNLPVRILVRLETGEECAIAVQHLQALGVVW